MTGRWLIAVLLLCAGRSESALAAEEAAFAEGASAYQSGHYAAAATAWGSPGKTSAGTLHNLGNAEFKLGHPGAAILAWERALALMPGSKNTAANLRFARAQAGLTEPQYAWYEKYAGLLSPGVWLAIATITFWSSIAFLSLPPLLKRRRASWTQAAAVVASALFLLTTPALAGIASRARIGVILVADAELRLTPTKEAEVLGKLSEGELGRLEKTRGDYVFVRGAADRAGWIQAKEFARIWP